MKKLLSLVLTLIMLAALVLPGASADPVAYNGSVLLAVNTSRDTQSNVSGSFASESPVQRSDSLTGSGYEGSGIYNQYYDRSGQLITMLEPVLPDYVPAGGRALCNFSTFAMNQSHAQGDTMTLKSSSRKNSGGLVDYEMRCLYIGQHCTVWGATSDDAAVCLTADKAAAIGSTFDNKFSAISNGFGSYWYDADNDGKLAIMCYDIEKDYGTNVSSYIGGYFWAQDMVGSDGSINGIQFASSYVNGIDCIHIDTYPGMGGSGMELSDVSSCYSTLFHEFQHMISFSYSVKNGPGGYFAPIESYLNEAFSMAAEHMICGSDSTSNRIWYFNSRSNYVCGTPLTYWNSTLSSYSNSYLFGQYLRTRYGQSTGTNGDALFKRVLESRNAANSGDTLAIIAGLLNTTPDKLINDFWIACYVKAASGVYGFNGESWATSISPVMSSFGSSGQSGINNGGAKYYTLGSSGFTASSTSSVTLTALNADGPVGTCGDNHSFGNWSVTTPPTCTQTGVETRTCSACGHKQTRSIPATGHKWDDGVVTLEATESAVGIRTYTCTVCDATKTEDIPKIVYTGSMRVSTQKARLGEDVRLTVSLEENPGICGMDVKLDYDSTKLTLKSCTGAGLTSGMRTINGATVIWADSTDSSYTGEVIEAVFTVADDAAVGLIPVTVTYSQGDITNGAMDDVFLRVYSGGVNAYARTPGDVSGDDKVNIKDVVLLMKLISGENLFSVKNSTDINNDTVTNIKDVVLLMKYLSGESVTIY